MGVSKRWRELGRDESVWKGMCGVWGFEPSSNEEVKNPSRVVSGKGKGKAKAREEDQPLIEMERFASYPLDPALEWLIEHNRKKALKAEHSQHSSAYLNEGGALVRTGGDTSEEDGFSYRKYFRYSYQTSTCPLLFRLSIYLHDTKLY